jgi:hypothetical protein
MHIIKIGAEIFFTLLFFDLILVVALYRAGNIRCGRCDLCHSPAQTRRPA